VIPHLHYPSQLRLLFVALALFAVAGQVFSCRADDRTQAEIVQTILRENRSIKAARAKWEAMRQRIPQERAWEDAMVGVDLERMGTRRFDDFADAEYMIAQVIPISGKNLSRGRMAASEAAVAFEDLRRVQLEAVRRGRAAYFGLATAQAQRAITAENQRLLADFSQITRAKYEAGLQSQSDLLIAEVELARIDQATANFNREISDRQSELNILMNRRADTPLADPADLQFTPLHKSPSDIEALALANRPELRRARKQIDAEQTRLQLARREWIPDPQFRVEARQFRAERGITEYDTGIFFSVPWGNFRKYSAGVREAKSNIDSAENEFAQAHLETLGLIRDQLKKIATAAHNYTLFNGKIVPLARQTIEATRAGYESDKAGFLELITARRSLQEAQSMAIDQLALHQTAVVELHALIGTDPATRQSSNKQLSEQIDPPNP
jgi:cobalt-zinc-cadmium efflux system outer membrane protein